MFTPDLVNLANQLSLLLGESPQQKTAKIHLQLQQMKVPQQNQNPPSFFYYFKEPGCWKIDCYKFKHFRGFQPSNQAFQHPNSQ